MAVESYLVSAGKRLKIRLIFGVRIYRFCTPVLHTKRAERGIRSTTLNMFVFLRSIRVSTGSDAGGSVIEKLTPERTAIPPAGVFKQFDMRRSRGKQRKGHNVGRSVG